MTNPRLTKKERNLIKGAVRRVFGRSDLRRKILEDGIIKGHIDLKRKAVKFWVKCEACGELEAKSNIQIDHLVPVVPTDSSFEDMSLDELVDRMWCVESNLKRTCKPCHVKKTLLENKLRRENKKKLAKITTK